MAVSDTTSIAQLARGYDPSETYEVRVHDVEYRRDGAESWLAQVYAPQGNGPFPAIVEVHGGAWSTDDRTQNAPIDHALAASGVVVAAIDFRLGPQAPYPAALADINYAIRWLKHHAGEFNASSTALGGLGFSSGGHLIALSALRPDDARYVALPLAEDPKLEADLAYVIAGWPVLDPHARYKFAAERGKQNLVAATERFFGGEAEMHEGNPQLILERGEVVALPPALIMMGATDEMLPPTLAERFVQEYARAGGVIELAKYPNAPHGFARQPGDNTARALDLMKSFIARQLAALARGPLP